MIGHDKLWKKLMLEGGAVIYLAGDSYPASDKEEETVGRYLESLSTPTLVIQGIRDEYGGLVQMKKYKFSQAVRFFYVKAGHGMNLTGKTLDVVRMRIERLIFEALSLDDAQR